MTYTIDSANALLRRMAFEAPWHPRFCGACGGFAMRHNDGPMPNSPRDCPLVPIPAGTTDIDAALRAKVARAEWGGAGCCFACHAMLPGPNECPDGRIINARQYHRAGCEVLAILGSR